MSEIIPGILEKEWEEIEKKLNLIKPFAKWAHIDVIDGKFAQNTTFMDPTPFKKYKGELFLEVHLMVEEPEQYIEPFANAGFRRFIGHIEKMQDQTAFVARGEMWGEVGLAIDGETPLDKISVNYSDLDFITIMTIKAGFSGQEFTSEYLEKVRELRKKTDLPIEVDGGINEKTAPLAKAAGANRFVENSSLFRGTSAHQNYTNLLEAIDGEDQTA
jgi:ribulose-phosphate 3-epimerase